jgi:DNA-binding NarL/FixJ family response regulator
VVHTPQSSALRQTPAAADGRIECVYLTCFQPDFSFLATVLYYSRIRMHRAETVEEADFLLTVTGASVLLTDVTFLDGSWRDALRMAADIHPHVAALVAAETVDRPFLLDSGDYGACGILWKPLPNDRTVNLIRTVDEAARNRAALHGEVAAAAQRS